jgi:O-acetylhomoserine/O-acetylserine sulfhydrylase-like pyridoxal-dependent enzyme
MTVRNTERIGCWKPDEPAVSNVIYIDAHRRSRKRRAEKYQEMSNGMILFAIIAFTIITCCLFKL